MFFTKKMTPMTQLRLYNKNHWRTLKWIAARKDKQFGDLVPGASDTGDDCKYIRKLSVCVTRGQNMEKGKEEEDWELSVLCATKDFMDSAFQSISVLSNMTVEEGV
jgi:hypothetical protein